MSKAYRLCNPNDRKTIVGRDVIFFEDQLSKQNSSEIKIFNGDNAFFVDDAVRADKNDDKNISSKSLNETPEDKNKSNHQEGAEDDDHIFRYLKRTSDKKTVKPIESHFLDTYL